MCACSLIVYQECPRRELYALCSCISTSTSTERSSFFLFFYFFIFFWWTQLHYKCGLVQRIVYRIHYFSAARCYTECTESRAEGELTIIACSLLRPHWIEVSKDETVNRILFPGNKKRNIRRHILATGDAQTTEGIYKCHRTEVNDSGSRM